MVELTTNWNKLPAELHRHILSYTYSPQPKYLLEDIRNYHATLRIVKDMYNNSGTSENDDEADNWIINDMYGWLNNDTPTMNGYVDNFIRTIHRYPYYHLFDKNIDNIIYILGKNPANNEIRILWGLLTPTERQTFISDRLYAAEADESVPMEIDD